MFTEPTPVRDPNKPEAGFSTKRRLFIVKPRIYSLIIKIIKIYCIQIAYKNIQMYTNLLYTKRPSLYESKGPSYNNHRK